jgi:PAS domain S-box-containing protein
MSADCRQDLFRALDLVALVCLENGRFALQGDPPSWFQKLCPDIRPGSLPEPPEEHFPFLLNFLVDAREFWASGNEGRIRSGAWIQVTPDGEEMALEASAVLLKGARILLIESCQYAYSEKQALVQTGRLMALDLHHYRRHEQFAKVVRDELETQVKTRTAALLKTNNRLKTEIEERRKTQQSLQESEHRFRLLFDNLFDAQLLMDVDGCIRDVNRAACQLMACSRDSLLGCPVNGVFVEQEVAKIDRAVADAAKDGIAYIEESVLLGENRERIPVEGGCVGLDIDGCRHVVFSLRDISYRKQLQAQLQQAQKMEAMGSLASGISHDFNNILSAIIGYTEIARMDLSEGSLPHKNLSQVLAASDRAKQLVQQILTFSRQTESVNKPVKISAVVTEALKLIRATMPASITIRQHLQSRSYVSCDPTQIHQICINLFSNAVHAMAEDGGELEVRLTDVDLNSDFTDGHPGITPGLFVELSVADTGQGIAESIRSKIFDPFFTTKAVGQGTGMGLSVVHGIVSACGGAITADNRTGKGSRFRVYLPAMGQAIAESPMAESVMRTGTERILFVDDEKFQTDLAVQALGRLGYRVVARTSSLESLALFEQNPDAFDLVITDLTMPQLSGTALVEKMHALRPDLPVILSSGFSSSISDDTAREAGFSAYLKKPLVMKDMAAAVREVLDHNKKP